MNRIGKIEQERKLVSDSFGNMKIIEDALKKPIPTGTGVRHILDI